MARKPASSPRSKCRTSNLLSRIALAKTFSPDVSTELQTPATSQGKILCRRDSRDYGNPCHRRILPEPCAQEHGASTLRGGCFDMWLVAGWRRARLDRPGQLCRQLVEAAAAYGGKAGWLHRGPGGLEVCLYMCSVQ